MFPGFFAGKQYMKAPTKVSIKKQRIIATPSRSQSPLSVFLREKITFDFFSRGAYYHVCNIYTYIKKISYFHVFLEKDHLSFSVQGKNMFSRKKYTIFPDSTRKIISQ